MIEVTCDEFYEQQHISHQLETSVNMTVVLTLCSNPSTGFQWEDAQISNQGVLQQLERQYIGPESEPPPPPGTPGQEKWTFKALKAGQSVVSMKYSRPWEGGEKGEWTYTLTVTVK